MKTSYHIELEDNYGARYAILPGDPGRVESIAKNLDNPRFLCQNREYTTWIGELGGEKVLVMSTGMGGPSTAIGVEELIKLGVDTFIRVGTCGGMQTEVIGGDIVIASGAIRMEGTTREYAPIEYPAVSDFSVTSALKEAADENGFTSHIGVVQSKDSFYGQHDPMSMAVGKELSYKWDAWIKAGCLASEMECASLFITSSLRRVRAGAVLHVIWNQERAAAGLSNPEVFDTSKAIRTAVDAIRVLIKKDSKK